MEACLDCRGMIAIFPKSALPLFSPVVRLSSAACCELNGLWDNLAAVCVVDQQMYMIGSSGIVENDGPKPLPGLKKPIQPYLPVFSKLQQKFLFVTTVGDMPNMTWNVIPAGSWHFSVSLA
jgi:hypothetical protein